MATKPPVQGATGKSAFLVPGATGKSAFPVAGATGKSAFPTATKTPAKKPTTGTTTTVPGGGGITSDDPFGGLVGTDRDAAVAIENVFQSYGISSLAPTIVKYIQDGYSSDTISILLQQTPEYKARFPANDARLKAGLPALSPAEYISTEQSYRQIMSAAGLPTGFYDSSSDFTNFLTADMSPTELQTRVDTASEAIQKAPPETLDYFKQWYSQGDLTAYALDPTVAAPLIEQRIKAAEAGALAAQNGAALTQANAERIGATGQDYGQIQQGVGFISAEGKTDDKLNQMFGGDETQSDLVAEVFENNAAAAVKRSRLASQDRNQFSGSSGQSKTSLTRDSGF